MKQKRLILLFAGALIVELLFIVFSWRLSCFANPYLIVNVDNLVSAQTARNLVHGKGYVTDSLSLYEVALYDKKGWLSEGPPWKNTYRFPLPIISMAALFKMFGDTHFVATCLYPSLFHLLSVAALFILTFLLFQNSVAAFIASCIFITNAGLLSTMLNRSEGADIFFFVVTLIAYVLWDKQRRISLLFILGVLTGLSFLNRFNEGAILFVTYLVFIFARKGFDQKDFFLYVAGFVISVSPFIVHNLSALGTPFFSSNSYFQFIDGSIISKYMNPWWKLNYEIDIENPFSYALSHPGDFLSKSLRFVYHYTLPDFVRFRGSVWWWMPLTYAMLRKPADEKEKALGKIFLIIFVLHVLLIAPLGLNIHYLQFLFVPPVIIVARICHEWYGQLLKNLEANRSDGKLNIKRCLGRKELFFPIVTLGLMPFSLCGDDIFSLTTCFLLVIVSLVGIAICLPKKRLAFLVIYAAGMILFSSVVWMKTRYTRFDIKAMTVEDPSVLQKIEAMTSPRQIILATHFWNPAWFSRRPSIPIPEYPDEIYSLMRKYGLDIRVIYLSHSDVFFRYAHSRMPMSSHSYLRMVESKLSIKGFAKRESLPDAGLLLFRDEDPLSDIMNTKEIDAGSIDSQSHLVYGFSSPATLDNAAVCWVVIDKRYAFDRQTVRLLAKENLVEYDAPDAEVTFLHDGTGPVNSIKIELFNADQQQTMMVAMNANLFSYGEKGYFVARVSLHRGWNSINLPLEASTVRQGLNKLSFWFGQRRPLSATDHARYLRGVQTKGKTFLGIAFKNISFRDDGNRGEEPGQRGSDSCPGFVQTPGFPPARE